MTDSETTRRQRAQEIAAMFAIAVIPRSFQRSLLPRSTVDQGVITSLTVVMVYFLGLLTQDSIDAASRLVTEKDKLEKPSGQFTTLVSAAALGLGLLSQKLNEYSPDETLPRSTARTLGKWAQYAGTAGLIIEAVEGINRTVSKDKQAAEQRDLLPYFMAAGLLYTLVGEYTRTKNQADFSLKQSLQDARPGRVIGITAGVTALVGGLVYAERFVARHVDDMFAKSPTKLKPNWLPVGHLVGVGVLGGAVYTFMRRTYGKIEHSAGLFETGFTEPPRSAYLSGGAGSLIDWHSLSIQGRRHVATALTPDQIEAVMGDNARQPIRIFVGLDSAPTQTERVELALAELERTDAYDRSCILVASPTGTGYINYVMSESVEYQTRGDVASVTIQYSKRPSPMSLNRVDDGHIQYRMLLNGISKRIQSLPTSRRPRLLVFGESLGAWTSQDAFVHSGTDGLRALHVDRALWIGTPMGSKWKEQALSGSRLNTDRELVGLFDSYDEVEQLDPAARDKLRYIMVTHHNDPIAQFGLDLLVKQPEWIADKRKRPTGLSDNIEFRSPTLFVQMLMDMKNALKPIPGEFVASAHDYRADLARFVAFSYGFEVTDKELAAIETALRHNEIARERRIKEGI